MIRLSIGFIIADALLIHLSEYYEFFGMEWHHMQVTSLLSQQILIASLIFYVISYKHLIAKTMILAFVVSEILELAQYLYIDKSYLITAAVHLVVMAAWLAYVTFRKYDMPGIEPKDDTLYLISKKPDNFWTFLPSLFTGTSGYSILCNGVRYGYKHGAFEIMDFSSQDNDYNFVTETSIKYTPELINYLKSKQGVNWHLWNNCITVHFKLKYLNWKSAHD